MINLNPFVNLLGSLLSFYSLLVFIYIIMYYLLLFKVINNYNQFVIRVNRFLVQIIEPVLEKIRKFIPNVAGIDISLIILFILIRFSKDVLYTYLYVY
ncbi:MAG: YggT family protein [Alphaproteobacteria bacterium]|jgi:YggT family protein|nr:YggT family protein [Alphaproteobacteria bacterium]MBT5827516.1 YggT family protein [Alphaproteobacteria bacterium]